MLGQRCSHYSAWGGCSSKRGHSGTQRPAAGPPAGARRAQDWPWRYDDCTMAWCSSLCWGSGVLLITRLHCNAGAVQCLPATLLHAFVRHASCAGASPSSGASSHPVCGSTNASSSIARCSCCLPCVPLPPCTPPTAARPPYRSVPPSPRRSRASLTVRANATSTDPSSKTVITKGPGTKVRRHAW